MFQESSWMEAEREAMADDVTNESNSVDWATETMSPQIWKRFWTTSRHGNDLQLENRVGGYSLSAPQYN